MGREYIQEYSKRGCMTNEFLQLPIVSKHSPERTLNKTELWRGKTKTDVAEVAAFIDQQPETSGQLS